MDRSTFYVWGTRKVKSVSQGNSKFEISEREIPKDFFLLHNQLLPANTADS